MSNYDQIEESIVGLSLELLGTANKQKTMLSGSFWKRFRFRRRTQARIDEVMSALARRYITCDIDSHEFGKEPRDERITFFLESDTSKKRRQIKESSTQTVKERLSVYGDVKEVDHSKIDIFSILFVKLFCQDSPNYELEPRVSGATTSNWTYHTAIAIAQASKILDLTFKFESGGKRDAIIEETFGETTSVILGAEWEWNGPNIFGKGKELEKLKITCETHPTSHAFLLTYCPTFMYAEFVDKVAKIWRNYFPELDASPAPFLHSVVFDQVKNLRQFVSLNTVVIDHDHIEVWKEESFI